MSRMDENLAFLLKYENVAWYENGYVKILDRRVYPKKIEYVYCKNVREVSDAIRGMITQSGGPFMAASMGMVLAAHECENFEFSEKLVYLENAANVISHSRPTTSAKMVQIVKGAVDIAKKCDNSDNITEAIFQYAIDEVNTRYARVEKRAEILADKINDGDRIMTQCFADAGVGFLCKHLKLQGKNNVTFFVPETRPYFQGSRLTASVITDMGYESYVITDNMVGITMQKKEINLAFSAADVITLDGNVINKVGTFNIALIAWFNKIPYYCIGAPSKEHINIDSVCIEERNADEIIYIGSDRYTLDGVKAYYPAFDITPPNLVSGIITERGMFASTDLLRYFE